MQNNVKTELLPDYSYFLPLKNGSVDRATTTSLAIGVDGYAVDRVDDAGDLRGEVVVVTIALASAAGSVGGRVSVGDSDGGSSLARTIGAICFGELGGRCSGSNRGSSLFARFPLLLVRGEPLTDSEDAVNDDRVDTFLYLPLLRGSHLVQRFLERGKVGSCLPAH